MGSVVRITGSGSKARKVGIPSHERSGVSQRTAMAHWLCHRNKMRRGTSMSYLAVFKEAIK